MVESEDLSFSKGQTVQVFSLQKAFQYIESEADIFDVLLNNERNDFFYEQLYDRLSEQLSRFYTVMAEADEQPKVPLNLQISFTLFAVGNGAHVAVHKVYVVLRTFLAHRAGAWLYPRICAYGKCGLCLAEALHEFDAGKPFPFLEHRRVERLAGDCAVLQRRQVVVAYILARSEERRVWK